MKCLADYEKMKVSRESTGNHLPYRILLAEDDLGVRQSLALVLESAGYDVTVAEHGVDSIFLLQKILPHLVIYELNLPQVRGHDFLAIVRTSFPQVSVIGMSSSTALAGQVPDGIFADAMYIKGHSGPEALLRTISDLIQTAAARRIEHRKDGAQRLRPTSEPGMRMLRAGGRRKA